jgi:hypothetical protein
MTGPPANSSKARTSAELDSVAAVKELAKQAEIRKNFDKKRNIVFKKY